MTKEIVVPVDTLRRAAEVLLDRLEDVAGTEVVIQQDMFWIIQPEQRFDLYVEPTEFTIGQLSESLDNVRRILEEPDLAISFGLVWLADLLRVAGETVIQ